MSNYNTLTHSEILTLAKSLEGPLVNGGEPFINSLLIGIDQHFVATNFSDQGNLSAKLLTMINILNQSGFLVNGEFPLEIFLSNALMQLGKLEQSITVRGFRDKAIKFSIVTQLIKIIEQSPLDEEKLKKIYHACLPIHQRKLFQYSHAAANQSLEVLFDLGKSQRHGFEICLFASVFGKVFSAMAMIDNWMDAAIAKMEWQFLRGTLELETNDIVEKFNNDADVSVEYLQVKITMKDPNNPNEIVALFHSWEQNNKADLVTEKIDTTIDDLLYEIDDRIESIAFVELFLPHQLMNANIEYAEEKDESLIVEHKVVRRLIDRQEFSKMTQEKIKRKKRRRPFNNWIRRWEKFSEGNNSAADLFHPIKTGDFETNNTVANLKIKLKRGQSICFTGCEFYPEEQFETLFNSHYQNGIPIMFWPGKSLGPLDLAAICKEHFNIETKSLLTEISKFQIKYLLKSEGDFHKHNLYCIYDDPDRMLPTVNPDEDNVLAFLEEHLNG